MWRSPPCVVRGSGRSRLRVRNGTCAAVRSSCSVRDNVRLLDRIRGSLLGAAIGDALGSAFEFVGSAAIERAIGSNVVRDYHTALPSSLLAPRRPGIPTDDTAMTLALI